MQAYLLQLTLTLIWYLANISFAQTRSSTISTSTALPFQITRDTIEGDADYIAPIFPLLPFTKYDNNPILTPNPDSDWESAYLYNPTAIVLNETIFLLYRAQNISKTSSIGLAWSTDGYNFTRLKEPIIYATEPWERGGGTEDPRIVRVDGTFFVTYTAFDNATSVQLCVATSDDMLTWKKYPPLFPGYTDVATSDIGVREARVNHTKSGAIVSEPTEDGLYHMYFGDSYFYHATSPDMLNWTAIPSTNYFAGPVHPWEERLIEPGPAPIKTRDGQWILVNPEFYLRPSALVYNGLTNGLAGYTPGQYSVGQMLIDPSRSFISPSLNTTGAEVSSSTPDNCPMLQRYTGSYQPQLRDGPLARLERPILVPGATNEREGQVDQVVFAEGLVQFKGKWFLYYGQGDSELGVAVADIQP